MTPASIAHEGAGFWTLVERRSDESPDARLLVDDSDDVATAAQYRDRAEKLARKLVACGVAPGDVVSWILPSSVNAAVLVAALARLGAVQNPLVPIYGEKEISFITEQAGTKLLVSPGTFRGVDFGAIARRVGERVGFTVVDAEELFDRDRLAAELPVVTDAPGAVRWLFYTSGTTSDPKGVTHTDHSLIAAGLALGPAGLRPGGRWGGAVPITHIGVPSLLAASLVIGMTMHLVAVFDPVETCERFREWEVDLVAGVGALVTALLDYQDGHLEPQFPALRVLMSGGGPRIPALLERVRGSLGCALAPSYGMTECPIVTASSPDDPDQALAEGEGRPTRGVQLRVVDAAGNVLPVGEEGEVRVKGPQLFAGYVDPSLDEGAFDEEGFFRSGDVGYLAPGGYLVITGRLKEVIVRNGENLSIREIEDVLLRFPGLADVAVVGVPDDRTGERVCAAVVPRDGAHVDLDAIQAFCLEHALMRQKVPEQLAVVDRIPRNPMGKVIRTDLRALVT